MAEPALRPGKEQLPRASPRKDRTGQREPCDATAATPLRGQGCTRRGAGRWAEEKRWLPPSLSASLPPSLLTRQPHQSSPRRVTPVPANRLFPPIPPRSSLGQSSPGGRAGERTAAVTTLPGIPAAAKGRGNVRGGREAGPRMRTRCRAERRWRRPSRTGSDYVSQRPRRGRAGGLAAAPLPPLSGLRQAWKEGAERGGGAVAAPAPLGRPAERAPSASGEEDEEEEGRRVQPRAARVLPARVAREEGPRCRSPFPGLRPACLASPEVAAVAVRTRQLPRLTGRTGGRGEVGPSLPPRAPAG